MQSTEAVRFITEQLELAEAMKAAGITSPSEIKALSEIRNAVSSLIKPKPVSAIALPDFEKIGDSIVLDRSTGLMWETRPSDKRMEWADAKTHASKITLGGFTDWRLPTRKELLTLVDDTRCDPAINTDFFPGVQASWYWTGTALASDPSSGAWPVGFTFGDSSWRHQAYGGLVLACRSASQS